MATIDERLLNVDRHGALAVPATLWLVMGWLARYWFVVVFILVSSRRAPETVRVLGGDFSWYMLALELPAILMIMTAGHRSPTASRLWRVLWARGRAILIATAAIHIAATAAALAASSVWRRWPELFLASCSVLDIAVIYALATDGFFRQLFSDFPAPPSS
ncbi:MAG TPA: DUF2919 family protein [Ramlibacter sp.]|uniref:DUF2919 family protein n=1 Tax=Ramlibacter sp. TaxID=1917967 RepID=UPI002BFF3C23|nr:DUF2919 family protein [Ramlibacter sp.]HVZ47060.1 DUF2919 family protein [Ramlibacter sp.]